MSGSGIVTLDFKGIMVLIFVILKLDLTSLHIVIFLCNNKLFYTLP